MKTLYITIIAISTFLVLIVFIPPAQSQSVSRVIDKENATLLMNFNAPEFHGCCGSIVFSHDGSMFAYSTSLRDPKSGSWKASLWLYYLKNDTSRSLDLNSNLSQISDISFSPDDKKLLFVGNGCDSNPSHMTFYVFDPSDIHLNCNSISNVRSADWMPDGSIILLQNNQENDTISIYQKGIEKLLYIKQITPPYISLNSSHIEFIKASPDGKKIALWYFVMLTHKTQILDIVDGKIIDTFDGGHPRWSQDSNMLLYTLPTSTGSLSNGARAVITYVDLLDLRNNKTSTIDSLPLGIDDVSLSADGKKIFDVINVTPPYAFMNFTSGIYEIDLAHYSNNAITVSSPLKQLKSGIPAEKVICKQGLQLIFKLEDGSSACVKPTTAHKLAERGWAKEVVVDNSKITHMEIKAYGFVCCGLDGGLLKGNLSSNTGPISDANVAISINGIIMGYAKTYPDGCFQFNQWNDSKLSEQTSEFLANEKNSGSFGPFKLAFSAIYTGDDNNHYPASANATSSTSLTAIPFPPPQFEATVTPSQVNVTQGSSANLQISVRPMVEQWDVTHMSLYLERLPCGISYQVSQASDNNTSSTAHPAVFNVSLNATTFSPEGSYFVGMVQNGTNPLVANDIGTFTLNVLKMSRMAP